MNESYFDFSFQCYISKFSLNKDYVFWLSSRGLQLEGSTAFAGKTLEDIFCSSNQNEIVRRAPKEQIADKGEKNKPVGVEFPSSSSDVITAGWVKVKGIHFSGSLHFLIITVFAGLNTSFSPNVIIKTLLIPPH